MNNQLTFVDIPKVKSVNTKRNWENRFQRWSDRLQNDETTPLGKCGYDAICEYCDCKFEYKNQCVRALRELQSKERIVIDYTKDCFDDIFTFGRYSGQEFADDWSEEYDERKSYYDFRQRNAAMW